jgi:hypothetical protein
MSIITKTNFGQINFRIIVGGVGFYCLGCGKHALRCSIMDGKRQIFTKDDLIHPFTYA